VRAILISPFALFVLYGRADLLLAYVLFPDAMLPTFGHEKTPFLQGLTQLWWFGSFVLTSLSWPSWVLAAAARHESPTATQVVSPIPWWFVKGRAK
jgi:hypothetical protein